MFLWWNRHQCDSSNPCCRFPTSFLGQDVSISGLSNDNTLFINSKANDCVILGPLSQITPKCRIWWQGANLLQVLFVNMENLPGLSTLSLSLSLRLSSLCSSWCRNTQKHTQEPASGALFCYESSSGESARVKTPKWILCWRLKTLTSQCLLDGHVILVFCISSGTSTRIKSISDIYCPPLCVCMSNKWLLKPQIELSTQYNKPFFPHRC